LLTHKFSFKKEAISKALSRNKDFDHQSVDSCIIGKKIQGCTGFFLMEIQCLSMTHCFEWLQVLPYEELLDELLMWLSLNS
jgi:hypothetical protein